MPRISSRVRTAAGETLTGLILEVFRLNGRLLAAGDRLTAGARLSSAKWQVLGAIALAEQAQPVASLARRMGLTRQAVQRIANDLAAAGLVVFSPNPNHQRAQLVTFTSAGRRAYEAARRRQTPWVNKLAEGVGERRLAAATRILRMLRLSLEEAERQSMPAPDLDT